MNRWSRRRRRAVGLAVSLASTLSALAAFEWALRAGLVQSEGYLQTEVWTGSGAGLRVLVIGDSFLARHQTADINDHLRRELSAQPISLLNPSRSGTSLDTYLALLQEHAPGYRPDVLLLGIYIGNDLRELGDRTAAEHLAALDRAPQRSWFQRLHAVRLATEKIDQHRVVEAPSLDWAALAAAGIPAAEIEAAQRFEVNPWVVALGAYDPGCYDDALFLESERARKGWDVLVALLEELMRRCRRDRIELLPILFPHTLQVGRTHHALYRSWKLRVSDAMLAADRPQRLLRELFERHGIEPLDLLADFRAAEAEASAGRGPSLYYERDEHLADPGQRLAAARIAERLVRVLAARSSPAPGEERRPR